MTSPSFQDQVLEELSFVRNELRDNRDLINELKEHILSLENKTEADASTHVPVKRARDPQKMVSMILARTEEIEDDRDAILKFNMLNDCKPDEDKLRWSETTSNAKGVETTKTFTRIDGNTSLLSLIKSEHKNVLENCGSKTVIITSNIIKKYRVLFMDGKLVPLSNDFKDGIGAEYLWTNDEDMEDIPPSKDWKNSRKKENDPRVDMIDPSTGLLWNYEEVEEVEESRPRSTGGKEYLFAGRVHSQSEYYVGKGTRGKELFRRKEISDEESSDEESEYDGSAKRARVE